MSGLFNDFTDAFAKRNNGLVQIILINVIVFLLLIFAEVILTLSGKTGIFLLIFDQLRLPSSLHELLLKPWTLITHFFTHRDIFHILFNMLFFYWFGKLIDEYLGNRRLINLYILGGLAGALAFLIIYNTIPYFQNQLGSMVHGASGAVYAVVVGAATLLPEYTFFLFLLGPVRIKYIAAFYVILSFIETIGSNAGGNIAHLGGALLGFIYIKQLQKGRDLGAPIDAIVNFFQNLFKKKERPPIKVTYRSQNQKSYSNASPAGFPDEDEVDEILDKISKSGYESLTKEEKQKLFRASQKQ
ncbi:Membrane associated serine protease, rhomboid family [Pseudarcicella hirudinis]|uniref:Membrane associated serine protease, rhomboid family n=1 Tax=Pseudarcicella hirudinis TaxID=1079859 RepID=A0A1I5QHD0_9BACT|nr:rhomboid family intramembrane serine protease [Pseudarcicella hirudinis]SFP45679.1 Membrane associated serine protease, rhomboid family [Pseudarcicella hirudinis]